MNLLERACSLLLSAEFSLAFNHLYNSLILVQLKRLQQVLMSHSKEQNEMNLIEFPVWIRRRWWNWHVRSWWSGFKTNGVEWRRLHQASNGEQLFGQPWAQCRPGQFGPYPIPICSRYEAHASSEVKNFKEFQRISD